MSKRDAEELKKSFRNTRGQEQISYEQKRPSDNSFKTIDNTNKSVSSDDYKNFLEKYHNMSEEVIQTYKVKDLMYHFREVARRNDIKYVISNMKRDLGIFNLLRKEYNNWEVCLMIEFLFESEQTYIIKSSIQPTVLTSSWRNKIYNDAKDWQYDKYVPDEPKKVSKPLTKPRVRDRTFITEDDNHKRKTRIGIWGDKND